ncbi:5614_t:CDS:2 [Entrophospora sp. SA101]|nr:5614_t:CDS:2 [Entrophospora sp. SA101]
MTDMNNLINALAQLTQALGQQQQQQNPPTATPKISVQIPPFKGESKENVIKKKSNQLD